MLFMLSLLMQLIKNHLLINITNNDMSFIKILMNGEQGLFKSETLTPMQKMTLHYTK